ncbi:MAG TPA: helix-turn-helix transcriptional regulator, partial [Actinospica sp.]|nr:helix-turn-helix transcriptional regulator [Actinospica sp.]
MGSVWASLPAGLNPAARRLVGELRALKDEYNLSLAQLSASTHYSRASWERWLNGKRLITLDALTAVSTRFGVNPALLITLLGEASLEREDQQEPGDAAAGEAPAGEHVALAQVPSSTSDFTGRGAQVEDLSAALLPGCGDPGQVSIAAITGGGGL